VYDDDEEDQGHQTGSSGDSSVDAPHSTVTPDTTRGYVLTDISRKSTVGKGRHSISGGGSSDTQKDRKSVVGTSIADIARKFLASSVTTLDHTVSVQHEGSQENSDLSRSEMLSMEAETGGTVRRFSAPQQALMDENNASLLKLTTLDEHGATREPKVRWDVPQCPPGAVASPGDGLNRFPPGVSHAVSQLSFTAYNKYGTVPAGVPGHCEQAEQMQEDIVGPRVWRKSKNKRRQSVATTTGGATVVVHGGTGNSKWIYQK